MHFSISHRTLFCALLIVCLLGSFGSFAWADPISYGQFDGNTTLFTGVAEDSGTDTPPLFGQPVISGDTLVFSPVGFNAYSAVASPAVDLTDGTLVATISADAGYFLDSLAIREAGDYTLAGIGTADTAAHVSTSLFVSILEVDGSPIAPVNFNQSMLYTPVASGDFNLVDHPGIGVIWEGEAMLDLTDALVVAGITGKATKVALSLDNTLLATSEAQSVAYIAKKQFAVTAETELSGLIPEPSVLTLLLAGLLGLAFVQRKGNN